MTTLIEETEMNRRLLPRIALIACGSFSPITPMHLRMFEIAHDHFELHGTHELVGGIISPTHDSYQKKGLIDGKHRCAMVKLALQSSGWIRVSDWEINQMQWSRTLQVLQYHQNYMNNYINSPKADDMNGCLPSWLPPGLREQRQPVQLKLLCGADLLESFAVPGLWSDDDIEDIVGTHGLVVISRSGANPERFIFESDILTKYQRNITLVTNWVPNEISSTMIRRLLSRGQSVKYLLDDKVIEYIKLHGLFNCKTKYLTRVNQLQAARNIYNFAYINQINISGTSTNVNTPSDGDGDVDDVVVEEHMDETDYSIKNILTSINLDNRKPNVFCCGDKESNNASTTTKLLLNRLGPGQAVQVITSEKSLNDIEHAVERTESKSKKVKTSTIENV